jgi:RNA recognition motif-containing protein
MNSHHIDARELPQHASPPPQFQVGSQTPAPQLEWEEWDRIVQALMDDNFSEIQQNNISTDSWMQTVSSSDPIEKVTLDSTQGLEIYDESDIPLTRIRLGNLPLYTTKQDIEAHFSTHGTRTITEIQLMQGFGFIEYEDARDAQDIASAFHGSDFMGSRMNVSLARGSMHTESRPRGQARLVREEGAGEAGSPRQASDQDRMPRDFEKQFSMQHEQQQHLTRFAIKGNVNPGQTLEWPPRFQKLRNYYEDGDVRNTGTENKITGSLYKRSITLN